MATQINLSDAFGAYERGAEVGRADKENRRQEELKTIAPQIMAGDEAAYTRGAQIDQKAAQGYQDEHTKKLKQLRAAAQYMKDKLDTGDEVAIQAAWSSGVRPFLAKLVPGKEVPEQWDKAQVPAIEQALAMTAFIDEEDKAGNRVQSTKVGEDGYYYTVDRNGNWQKSDVKANPNIQVIEQEGNTPFGVVKSGGVAGSVVPIGAGGAPAPAATATPTAAVSGSNPNEPIVMEAANAMIAAGVPEAQVDAFVQAQLSKGVTVQPPAANNLQTSQVVTGGPVRTPTAGEKAGEIAAAQRDAQNERPALAPGYRYAADGNQEFIPGGPADPSVIAASNTAKADASNKPLPAKALQLQLEATDALNTAETVDQTLGKIIQQIDEGTLDLSLAGNVTGGMRNYFGYSNDNSVNLAGFKAGLEKMRNDILILNKGVQTEGDATRAMNAILASPNDEKVVRSQMVRLRELNKRAEELQKKKIQIINQNYGRSGDEDGEPATDDVTDLLNKYGQP